MDEKVKFTMEFLKEKVSMAIDTLEDVPKDHPLDSNYAIMYFEDPSKFDINTVRGVAASYDSIDNNYRVELSLLFKNNVNIDQDYLVLEVWERDDMGQGLGGE